MRPMKTLLALLIVLPVVLVTVHRAAGDDAQSRKGISDDQISLYPGSVFEVPVPPPVVDNESEPGEAPLPPRLRRLPPVIPHEVTSFLPLTRESNACIDCHAVDEKVEGEPTPIPKSHYVDLRNAPDKVGETVSGARYNCVQCHVAPTAAKPLVDNSMN